MKTNKKVVISCAATSAGGASLSSDYRRPEAVRAITSRPLTKPLRGCAGVAPGTSIQANFLPARLVPLQFVMACFSDPFNDPHPFYPEPHIPSMVNLLAASDEALLVGLRVCRGELLEDDKGLPQAHIGWCIYDHEIARRRSYQCALLKPLETSMWLYQSDHTYILRLLDLGYGIRQYGKHDYEIYWPCDRSGQAINDVEDHFTKD